MFAIAFAIMTLAHVFDYGVKLSNLKTGKMKGIRFETLDAICKVLNCQPGDLMEYKS